MRAAVLGCGRIGAGDARAGHPDVGIGTHCAAYAACADTRLVAVCDTDLTRAAAAARAAPGVAAYADAGALLDAERPELVSVCTPDDTHAALVERVLRTPGVQAVLAEKPLAGSAPVAYGLALLARERGVVLAVNHTRRYPPAYRSLARADLLGDVQSGNGAYVGGLRHNGTHLLDLLGTLAGAPVCVAGRDRLGEGGPDPTLDAELTLAGGARIRLAGLDDAHFTHFELDLLGTRGRIRIAESGHRIETWTVGEDPRHPGYRALSARLPVTGALRDALAHAVSDVVRAVRTQTDAACTGEDGAVAVGLADGVAASAADGGRPYCPR